MHDGAVPTLDHRLAEGLRTEQVAGQVNRQQQVPLFERHGGQRARKQHAGVVDQNVTRPNGSGCMLGGSDTLRVGDIAGESQRSRSARTKHLGCRPTPLFVLVEQHDRRASLCHAESNGASNATARAGHNADAILETKPIGILLRHTHLASAVRDQCSASGSTTIETACCNRGDNCSAETRRRLGSPPSGSALRPTFPREPDAITRRTRRPKITAAPTRAVALMNPTFFWKGLRVRRRADAAPVYCEQGERCGRGRRCRWAPSCAAAVSRAGKPRQLLLARGARADARRLADTPNDTSEVSAEDRSCTRRCTGLDRSAGPQRCDRLLRNADIGAVKPGGPGSGFQRRRWRRADRQR